jgi:hypothetical protein
MGRKSIWVNNISGTRSQMTYPHMTSDGVGLRRALKHTSCSMCGLLLHGHDRALERVHHQHEYPGHVEIDYGSISSLQLLSSCTNMTVSPAHIHVQNTSVIPGHRILTTEFRTDAIECERTILVFNQLMYVAWDCKANRLMGPPPLIGFRACLSEAE